MGLTKDEQHEIEATLKKASERERKTASESKNGFLNWLKTISLGHLAGKFIDLAWSAIKAYFGWL